MPSPHPPPRVLLLSPFGISVNPYIGLLCDGLRAAGAEVRLAARLEADDLLPGGRPDVIHLHWLDQYDLPPSLAWPWAAAGADLPRRALRRAWETVSEAMPVYQARRWLRLRRLFGLLRAFQAGGGVVAFTVHNLDPHDAGGWADRWGLSTLLRRADLLHVHDAATADAVATRIGRRAGVAVIPHGHYLDSYPNTIGRSSARARLGLPDTAFVYLSLGLVRPYKGLEELIPAFRGLVDEDLRLVIAGRPRPAAYGERLAALAAGDRRIRFEPRFVPADEVQVYMVAADICVLPYRQITTSGAALLALSFGLPVLAPAIGAFPLLLAGSRGILYDPAQENGLRRALEAARKADWTAARERLIGWTAQFDWPAIGAGLLAAYREA